MLARAHALVVLSALASSAHAEVVDLPNTLATIDVAPSWRPVTVAPAATARGLVAGYRTDGGLLLAITRAQVPNPDAWRAKTRDAYVDEVARGLLAAIADGKQLARATRDLGGVPALDLEVRRKDGATILVRMLLMRTYALTSLVEVPKGSDLAPARATLATFTSNARTP